jgi:Protein of unknown function (DUF2637)
MVMAIKTGPDRADQVKVWIMFAVNAGALFQSYRALLDFASHTVSWPLWSAWMFPLFIDSFIVCGELQLYTARARSEAWMAWAFGWLLFAAGLAASVAGNIAHAGPDASLTVRLVAAVPPLAAAASLGVVLGLVRRKGESPPSRDVPREAPRTASPARVRPARRTGKAWVQSAEAMAIAARIRSGEDISRRQVVKELKTAGISVTPYAADLMIKAVRSESNGKG